MDPFTTTLVACTGILASIAVRGLRKKYVTVVTVPMNFRSIHSRDGKLMGVLEPGRYRFFGTGHQFQLFDHRLQQLGLQTQELTTAEGISVKLTATALYRIVDPVMATSTTTDYASTLYTLIQLAVRDAFSGTEAESILSTARTVGPRLLEAVQAKAAGLGLELTELVVRDVILPAEIKTALSESWRSKKSALAEIEAARGKAAAARTLANAAKLYDTHPALLKIRYIEALEQASKGMGNTFVVGLPDEAALKRI